MSALLQAIRQSAQLKNWPQVRSQVLNLLDSEPTISNYSFVSNLLRDSDKDAFCPRRMDVYFLRSFTLELVEPILDALCFGAGINVRIAWGLYDNIKQEVLQPDSALYTTKPDVVVLAQRLEDISPRLIDSYLEFAQPELEKELKRIEEHLEVVVATLRGRLRSAKILIHGFTLPVNPALGFIDAMREEGQAQAIHRLNVFLLRLCRETPDVFFLDVDRLIRELGWKNWFDPKMWAVARSPISGEGLISLAEGYSRFLRAAAGLTRKCLVVDLDNTLWGGIVGEVGVNGIELGPEPPGSYYVELQRVILNLARRGTVLAINSKNNEADALSALENHPSSVLRKEHFSSIRINWDSKIDNLISIAGELKLGLDSLVFLDDSPVECALVREMLPEVQVVQLPGEPRKYAEYVRKLGVFESLFFSAEDTVRTKMYNDEVVRGSLRESSKSIEEFMFSLETQLDIARVTQNELERVAQLVQKTNQFNLTTKRYSKQELAEFLRDPEKLVYCIKAKDRFGDYGLIGVLIVDCHGSVWEIDTLLLSCRVIGRTIENGVVAFLLARARENAVSSFRAEYRPTAKNGLASSLFDQLGFEKTFEDSTRVEYVCDPFSSPLVIPPWIQIRHLDREMAQ